MAEFSFFLFPDSFVWLLNRSLRAGILCSSYLSVAWGRMSWQVEGRWGEQNSQTVFSPEIVDFSMPGSTPYMGCILGDSLCLQAVFSSTWWCKPLSPSKVPALVCSSVSPSSPQQPTWPASLTVRGGKEHPTSFHSSPGWPLRIHRILLTRQDHIWGVGRRWEVRSFTYKRKLFSFLGEAF